VSVSDAPYGAGSWGPPPAAPVDARAPAPARHRWLEIVFIVGLAGVFLVNAAVAVLSPSDFTDLIDKSSLADAFHLTGSVWVAGAIFVHDVVVGLAVLATIWIPWRGLRLAILAWAGLWLLLVAVVKLTAL
jgi:hypothetical protein